MKLKKNITTITLLAVLTLLGIHTAFADVTAVYKMTSKDGSGLQTIRYADKNLMRLDMSFGANNEMTMMKLGDKTYMINGKVVQDLDELTAMMAMMGKGTKKSHSKQTPIKYVDTGRTETIAGITGKVYSFKERGKQHEIVFAEDKDLQAAVLSLVELTNAVPGAKHENPMNQSQQDSSLKDMALLRVDDVMRLQSMNTKSISKSVFVLPAKPQQMGGMGALMKGLMKK